MKVWMQFPSDLDRNNMGSAVHLGYSWEIGVEGKDGKEAI
jgi:hypothetical protein